MTAGTCGSVALCRCHVLSPSPEELQVLLPTVPCPPSRALSPVMPAPRGGVAGELISNSQGGGAVLQPLGTHSAPRAGQVPLGLSVGPWMVPDVPLVLVHLGSLSLTPANLQDSEGTSCCGPMSWGHFHAEKAENSFNGRNPWARADSVCVCVPGEGDRAGVSPVQEVPTPGCPM